MILQKDALIISSINDLFLKIDNNKTDLISSDFQINLLSKDIKLSYLFDQIDLEIDLYEIVGDLTNFWYRNKDGSDNICNEDISIGPLLQYRLAILISNYIRVYFAINKISKKYKKIFITENMPSMHNEIIKYFDYKLITNSMKLNNKKNKEFISSYKIMNSKAKPSLSLIRSKFILSFFGRLIQKPFNFLLKNKILCITDWTFPKIKQKDILNINKFNFFNSFYIIASKYKNNESRRIFPNTMPEMIIKDNIKRIIAKYNLPKKNASDLIDLIYSVIENEYLNSRSDLMRIYLSVLNMYNYYKPKMVIIPGYAGTFNQMLTMVAKSKFVKSLLIVDGVSFYLEPLLFPKDRNDDSYIDYFMISGELSKKMWKNQLALPNKSIFNIHPPIINVIQKSKKKKLDNRNKFVLILMPYCIAWSPYANFDQRYEFIIEILSLLNSFDEKNIKIKIKSAVSTNNTNEEINILEDIMKANNFNNIEILKGDLDKCLINTKYCVGEIGASIFESIYFNVPYYVYQPKKLGMNSKLIRSSIISDDLIHKTVKELKNGILEKKMVNIHMDNFLNGNSIKKINFNNLIH